MPNAISILPNKYYLDHAHELFRFVATECAELLSRDQQEYLVGIKHLSETAQCLLVRCLARKPAYIKINSLNYTEIGSIGSPLSELRANGYLRYTDANDWRSLVCELTKPQLVQALEYAPVKLKASDKKQCLVDYALEHINGDEPHLEPLLSTFIARRQSKTIDYIFFLFFGDIRNRFQQFVMRDLGVMKTRNDAKTVARFETHEEAISAFTLQQLRRDFMQAPTELRESTASYLLSSEAIGHSAKETRDKLLLSVGAEFSQHDSGKAIELWKASEDPKAIEKWVRESYRNGDKETLKLQLTDMRDQELAATTKVFIEDFYARKFDAKRTSIYTDMLREAGNRLAIDEAFINDVELGVIEHYQQLGVTAIFSENKFWRVLFGLTFWDLLFGPDQKQYSEFDRLPRRLRDKQFYTLQKDNIEKCLDEFRTPQTVIAKLTQRSVLHYGKPSGIFRWSPTLLDTIRRVLNCNNSIHLANVLRRMAQHYRHTKDGYPDLLIIDNNRIRFEEIKAPGDVLRANQLVSINRLRSAGFEVSVSQVNWANNPKQIYSVVDIETTGGRKGGHAITEIAVVHVQAGEIIGEWSTLVNPRRHVPAHITRLTGIDNSMVANAPTFAEIADELEDQLRNTIFVAHNVGFDYGFIKAAYEANNRSFRKPKFCTVANSRKAFPGLKSYSLANLTAHFDIDLNGHHRALNDATATAHLLRLIQETRRQSEQLKYGADSG